MEISSIGLKYQYRKINNNVNNYYIISFGNNSCRNTDKKSFINFQNWAAETEFLNNAKSIINNPSNVIGNGFEGEVYSIPNSEEWVIKKYFRSSILPTRNAQKLIEELDDISPELNIGQAIAKINLPLNDRLTETFFIHKKQKGTPIGINAILMNTISDGTTQKHLESLENIANLPQESFNKLIDDIDTISKLGYKIDGTTPNNILFDSKTNSINFVDIADKDSEKNSQYSEVLYPLLGAAFSERFLNSNRSEGEKEKAKELSETIIKKFMLAMKNANVRFSPTYNFYKLTTSTVFIDFTNKHKS